jgi:large subunit ribosomal protein L25
MFEFSSLSSVICYNKVNSLKEKVNSSMAQDIISIDLKDRKVMGKAVKHLRAEGFIPAVIHDHGKPSVHVQGESVSMLKIWRQAGKHHPVEIKTDGQSYVALIKDAAFDPRKHQLTHVVFNAVDRNQKVEADIPVRPKYAEGNEASPAERSGLIVLAQLESVQVRAIANKLPDFLEYDAEKLVEIGDHVTVSDIIVPEGVEFITEPEHSLATVYEPSALAAANDAAGGTAEDEAEAEATEEGETPEAGEQSDAKSGETEQKDSSSSDQKTE